MARNLFGSNNTNAGIFGSDLTPAAELVAPAIRARYLLALSRIPRAARGSAQAAADMRNAQVVQKEDI
jgi:hypothetical protein